MELRYHTLCERQKTLWPEKLPIGTQKVRVAGETYKHTWRPTVEIEARSFQNLADQGIVEKQKQFQGFPQEALCSNRS